MSKQDCVIWFSINGQSTIDKDEIFRKNSEVETAQIVNGNFKLVYKNPNLPSLSLPVIRLRLEPFFLSVAWQGKEIKLTILGGFLFGDVISILEKPFMDVEKLSWFVPLHNGLAFSTLNGKTISVAKVRRFNRIFKDFSLLDLETALNEVAVEYPNGKILETNENALRIGKNLNLEEEIREELDSGATFWEALREWLWK